MSEKVKNTWRNKPTVIIIVVIFILLIFLLLASLLIQSGVFGGIAGIVGDEPTAIAEESSDSEAGTPSAGDSATLATATATPTRVVQAGTPTHTPTTDSSASTNTPTKAAESKVGATATPEPTTTPTAEKIDMEIANLLRNGTFEWGIGDDGVAMRWQPFSNGGAKVIFAAESWPLAILDGDYAQRITIYEAHQPDRIAGIYQTMNVISGESYHLKLNGQIRSMAGDIKASQYGYRMQYAIDWQGGTDWQAIPEEEWVELPWDEQLIDNAGVEYTEYATTLVPPSGQLTLFIRAWNKWADPVEAQYTLDTLSLVGPAVDQVMVDQSLPLSGAESSSSTWLTDWLLWLSILFLIFLVGATLWRNKYRRTF